MSADAPAPASSWGVSALSKALFCPACASILNLPSQANMVECPDCEYSVHVSDMQQAEQTQTKRYEAAAAGEDGAPAVSPTMRRATVAEACPECNYHELRFYTMQMRSVDEGQTVFYECEKCGHTYSTNT